MFYLAFTFLAPIKLIRKYLTKKPTRMTSTGSLGKEMAQMSMLGEVPNVPKRQRAEAEVDIVMDQSDEEVSGNDNPTTD